MSYSLMRSPGIGGGAAGRRVPPQVRAWNQALGGASTENFAASLPASSFITGTPWTPSGGVGTVPSGGMGGGPIINQGGGINWGGIVNRIGEGIINRLIPSTGGASPGEGSAGSCPSGYRWNPSSGACEATGVSGTVQRMLPGGRTGTSADIYGEAVVGSFGIPALVPAVVGQVTDKNGNTKPIQRCPPGAVLGKDNLCYMKGSIPRQFRKWKPAPRPVMSAKDAKAIRSIGRLQTRVKKLAGDVGFTCRKR